MGPGTVVVVITVTTIGLMIQARPSAMGTWSAARGKVFRTFLMFFAFLCVRAGRGAGAASKSGPVS